MTVEQRLDQLEKRNKRLTVALTMTVVAMAAVVTMAATGDKNGTFHTVTAQYIFVKNDAGDVVVGIGADDVGDGLFGTRSAKGNDLVVLGSTMDGEGTVTTYQPNGKELVALSASASDNGGLVYVYNKTGENIVQMYADDYGNGVVWAGNRKGLGRELKPGP